MSAEEWKRLKSECPVRVQWDPERDLLLRSLPHRSLQMGLEGAAIRSYVRDWIVGIEDVTPLALEIHGLVQAGRIEEAKASLPAEKAYPLSGASRVL